MSETIDLALLQDIVGPEGVVSGDGAERYDAAGLAIGVEVLVKPKSTEEVSALAALCNDKGWPIVPFGGLTGLADAEKITGPSVALSLERMNQIEKISESGDYAQVQAGVILQNLHETVAERGLMFPLDLGARGSCTVGGNAATNAGGLRVLRYGMMRQLVLGMEVVLANGEIINRLQPMIKNNAGYDFKQWFIGAEGTLGIITRLTLRLYPQPKSELCALVSFEHFEQAATFLQTLKAELPGLSAFEIMWDNFYRFMLNALQRTDPMQSEYPFYAVVEAHGSDYERDADQFESVLGAALERNLIADAVLTQSLKEQRELWAIRDDTSCLYSLKPLYSYDVSLDIGAMPSYVSQVQTAVAELWPDAVVLVFGHMGDGNLHLAISCGEGHKAEKQQLDNVVYAQLKPVDGCVSAEHGIGLAKRRALLDSRGEREIEMMRQMKLALDKNNILNPGKLFFPVAETHT